MDLAQPVGPAALPFAEPFAVITACNPRGLLLSPAENARRNAELEGRIRHAGYDHVPATGRSPDGSHAEPGWAVIMTREAALALAREFDQLAIYWWDGSRFWIYWKDAGRAPEALR